MTQELDDLGAVVPPQDEISSKARAAEALRISTNPVFQEATRQLTLEYAKQFAMLRPNEPNYERQCVIAQISMNVVKDIANQLAILADYGKIEKAAEAAKNIMRGR